MVWLSGLKGVFMWKWSWDLISRNGYHSNEKLMVWVTCRLLEKDRMERFGETTRNPQFSVRHKRGTEDTLNPTKDVCEEKKLRRSRDQPKCWLQTKASRRRWKGINLMTLGEHWWWSYYNTLQNTKHLREDSSNDIALGVNGGWWKHDWTIQPKSGHWLRHFIIIFS